MAVLAVVLSMAAAPQALADRGILAAFQNTYPGSTSDVDAGDKGCPLCHRSSKETSLFNEYGSLLFRNGVDFVALEQFPSVNINGGTTMLDEINAGTQPGWTSGPNNIVYIGSTRFIVGDLPPASITGELDPVVVNTPPTADPGGPYTGVTGVAVMFDGSASSDPDGSITTYDWDFGDGGTATGVNPTHTYAGAGDFTVTLTVTDNDGDSSSPATTNANISPATLPRSSVPLPWLPFVLELIH